MNNLYNRILMQLFRFMFFVNLLFFTSISCSSSFDEINNVIKLFLSRKVNDEFQFTTLWNSRVGHGTNKHYSILHPAFQDDRIFIADRYGVVKSLDINTGKNIWSVNLSIPAGLARSNHSALLSGGITFFNNRIYIGSESAKVYALYTNHGDIAWQTDVAGEVVSSPVVSSNGIVLVHTSNGKLQALNECDGIIKWTINFNTLWFTLRGASSPAVVLDTVILGESNGSISTVLLDKGELMWQKRIAYSTNVTGVAYLNDIQMTPVVVDGIVYAVAYNGVLAALDLSSGEILWSRNISSVHDIIIENGSIYLIDQDDRIMAISKYQGVTLWCQDSLLHHDLTAPTLYNGWIIAGDAKGYLYVINKKCGSVMSHKKINNIGFLSKAMVVDDKLIMQAKNGDVYAFISKI